MQVKMFALSYSLIFCLDFYFGSLLNNRGNVLSDPMQAKIENNF